MTQDANEPSEWLAGLCRAARSGAEPQALFREAAEAARALTGCVRARLCLAADARPALVTDFAESGSDPGVSDDGATVRWVLDHRQPRLSGPPGPTALYLPLVCRGEVVGALELVGTSAHAPETWERTPLQYLADLLALALDNLAAHERIAELQRYQRETAYLRGEMRTDRDLRPLTGESPAMKAVRLAVQQVARTDSTVLIQGETGTGKELVARAIHQLSPRRDRLLVAVNCAALAPGVIASELFGHEAGAFTGATRRRAGRFELADRGTIFLDEVGEVPPETQVLLLRVLQERVIERVGGGTPVPVDVRVIAATHQDLEAAVARQRFRDDLFFRLNVFPIRVPPLRERREDIPDLVRHFVQHFSRRLNKPALPVNPAAMRRLTAYHWPGNVRELENLIERAMIVAAGDTLDIDPSWLRPAPPAAASDRPGLADVERQAILDALARCRGKVYGPDGAAAALGLKPTTLYGKMRKHGIARDSGAG